jgi:hypothetical protein
LVISFERKIRETKVTDPDAGWENDALDAALACVSTQPPRIGKMFALQATPPI